MVDENDTNESLENAMQSTEGMNQSIPDGTQAEGWSENVLVANENTLKFNETMKHLGGISGSLGQSLGQASQAVGQFGKTIQEQAQTSNKVEFMSSISGGVNKAKEGLKQARSEAEKNSESVKEFVEKLKGAGKAGAAVGIAIGQKKILEGFDASTGGALKLVSQIQDLEGAVLNIGMSFGKSFSQAEDSEGQFREKFKETVGTLYATEEQMKGMRDSFKGVLDVSDQIAGIEGLEAAQKDLGTTLSLTNVAFLTSKATGMDSAKVADMLSRSVSELGDSHKQAALNMGAIRKAGESSGLGFEVVSKSIMDSTDSLKMWGGTVGAVTPLFQSFAESITTRYGIGRRGLTPELLQSFTKGLQGMDFSTRALMGIQSGGAGKGAIGAGLEMEAALEKGDYGKITEGITETLKQFGGGQIVTREEAIENPTLERNFMVQRQLLQQQLGLDQASATKMMGIMQDMDKNGVAAIEGQQGALEEMLGGGKSVAESTTGPLEKAAADQAAAVQGAGAELVKAIRRIAEDLGNGEVAKVIRAGRETVKNIVQRGSVDLEKDTKFAKEQWQSAKTAEEQGLLGEDGRPIKKGRGGGKITGQQGTLEQMMGGGKIVTREDALDNPELERDFIIQRQLLKQQTGLNTSSATKMLGSMQQAMSPEVPTSAQTKSRDPFASGEFERREQQEARKPKLSQAQVSNWDKMSDQEKRQAVESPWPAQTTTLADESQQPRAPTQPISDDILKRRRTFKNQFEAYAGKRQEKGGAPDLEEEREFNKTGIKSEVRRDRKSERDMDYIRKRTSKFSSRADMLASRANKEVADQVNTEEPESRARKQAAASAPPKRKLDGARPAQSDESGAAKKSRRGGGDKERLSKSVQIDIELTGGIKGTSIDLEPIVKKINRQEYVTSKN